MRKVQTVLFTDIVGSTQLAAELEDRRWRALLHRHHAIVRRELRRFGGREIDTAGDGFLATFDEPTRGIQCAWAITDAVQAIGLEVRAGLHTGEVEVENGKVGGIAVHTAARIVAQSGPGEVLVSGTLRELAAGSGAVFEDRGRRRLKGVTGTWRLFAVTGLDGFPAFARLSPEIAVERRKEASQPGPKHRKPFAALIAGLVVGAAVVVMFAVFPDDPRGVPASTRLVLIDPNTNRVAQASDVRLPSLMDADMAAGEGGIWLIQRTGGGRSVVHLNPDGGRIMARIPLPRSTGTREVAVGERSVWVLSQGPAENTTIASQVNPATDKVTAEAEIGGLNMTSDPAGLAVGEDAVWVATNNGTIARLDPLRNRVLDHREAVSSAYGIAAGEGFVWAIDELSDAVLKVDPASLQAEARISLVGSADAIVVGEGAVWVLDRTSGAVLPVNPRAEVVGDPIRTGEGPSDIAWAWAPYGWRTVGTALCRASIRPPVSFKRSGWAVDHYPSRWIQNGGVCG